jgi:DnaJ family protein B protein 13
MGNPPELYYKVLNITRDTPPQEIRAAYRCLVRQWHPDKHPPESKTEAEAMFKAITQAYEVTARSVHPSTLGQPCFDLDDAEFRIFLLHYA